MESKLQSKIIKYLEAKGWYVLKVMRCNKSGHPDLSCFKDKRCVFIEVKDEGEKAEPLQELRLGQLSGLGFQSFVIDRWSDFEKIIIPIL